MKDSELLEALLDRIADKVAQRLKSVESTAPPKLAFRIPEVAGMLSLSERSVRDFVIRGELHSIKLGRNIRLVPLSAMQEFLSARVDNSVDNCSLEGDGDERQKARTELSAAPHRSKPSIRGT